MNSEDYKRCNETFSEIVHKGIEEYVKKEIDEVIKGESSTVTIRRKRFEEDFKKSFEKNLPGTAIES